MNTQRICTALAFSAMLAVTGPAALADAIVPHERMQQSVDVEVTAVRGTVIEGVLTNLTDRRIEDPELSIHYAWLWSDALNPGADDVGWVATHTVDTELAPRAAVPFTFDPGRPLPARNDGRIMPLVSVVGYTQYD